MPMTSPQNPEATTTMTPTRAARPGMLDSLGRKALFGKLQDLRNGCLVLMEGNERHRFGKPSAELPEPVIIHVHDANLRVGDFTSSFGDEFRHATRVARCRIEEDENFIHGRRSG